MPYKAGELPHGGHGSDPRTLKDWRASEPLVDAWLSKKRPRTARKYGEDFRAFWLDLLSQRYKSIEEWLDAVKKAQYEPDFEIQTAWAKDLEAYILAKKISHKTRAKIASAVMSLLEPRIGKQNARNYKFTFGTSEEVDAEAHESDTETIDYHDNCKARPCGQVQTRQSTGPRQHLWSWSRRDTIVQQPLVPSLHRPQDA